MHSYNGAYTSRLFRLLRMSGINFVANPLVNIHLQGRFDTYPKRRYYSRQRDAKKVTLMSVLVMMMSLILGIQCTAVNMLQVFYIWIACLPN